MLLWGCPHDSLEDGILETIKGCVSHIIFRNSENGYTVFELEQEEGELTCVGSFPMINEGENIQATGEYKNHPSYIQGM